MRPLGADSAAIVVAGGSERLLLRPVEARLERADGRNYAGAVARGAIIGALTLVAVPLIAGENIYRSEGALLVAPLALVGGAYGVGAGLLLAPTRWVPVHADPPTCSRWALAPGSSVLMRRGESSLRGEVRRHDASRLLLVAAGTDEVVLDLDLSAAAGSDGLQVELGGIRDRRRAATVGALLLGGIGFIGAATDESISVFDASAAIGGNVIIGAALGAWWAPRRRHPIALACAP